MKLTVIAVGIASVTLFGCAPMPHKVERVLVANRVVEIHTDAPADIEPKECGESLAGCFDYRTWAIFLRSPVRRHTLTHELGHADGMVHGPWITYDFWKRRCAVVTASGGKYRAGQAICVSHVGEEVFADATFAVRLEA